MASIIEKQRQKVDEYLTQIRQGDGSALSPLYEQTAKPLYTLCYSYMRNHHDSEDALSETFLNVVRNIKKYKGKNGFNWLYTIAKNICLNMMRKKERVISVDYNDEETVNVLDLAQEAPRMQDESGIIAFSQKILNEKEFRIVVLHAVNEVKFKDIARIVGGLESTVRWQYHNAIKKVKELWERRTDR